PGRAVRLRNMGLYCMAEVARTETCHPEGSSGFAMRSCRAVEGPYELYRCASEICREKRPKYSGNSQACRVLRTSPFASVWAAFAHDDSWFRSWGFAPR